MRLLPAHLTGGDPLRSDWFQTTSLLEHGGVANDVVSFSYAEKAASGSGAFAIFSDDGMIGSSAVSGGGGDGPQFLGDDIPDDTSSTTSIAVGGSLASSIQSSGDRDYIRVTLVAGQTYVFSLEGGTMLDPFVELRTTGNVLLAQNDDAGIRYNSFLRYTATQSGDYFIVARGFDGSPTSIGTYTLSVNAIQTGNSSPTVFPDNGKPQFSWDEAAIQITRDGASWGSSFGAPAVVTYAYRSTAPSIMPDDTGGFSRFNASQIAAAEAALASWAAVANITFVRVNDGGGYSNNATILLANYSTGAAGAAAFATLPTSANTSSSSAEGDVWVNVTSGDNASPTVGGYGWQVLLHEIGHAIGLDHPGDYNAGPNTTPTYSADAVYFQDTRMFTVMSYFGSINTGGDLPAFAALPQSHDIAAIQRLYGANLATRTGDTIYGFNSNTGLPQYAITLASQGAVFAIWDGGGLDTLDLSGYSTNSIIDLRPEAFTSAGPGQNGPSIYNISIARGVIIENAIGGTGADTIYGNTANNTLNGGAGGDTMFGGTGNDTFVVDNAGDTANENSGEGADTVQASVNFTLGANVENLVLTGAAITGTGNGLDNIITGNSAANTLNGGGGADALDGGAGADTMAGGAGDDTYVVDNAGDAATENASEGADTVQASVSFVLGANVENLVLTGSGNINGTGNSGNNTLTGNGGDNTLDGGGGADAMAGGGGNDTYVVDDAGDTVTENASAGADAVQASVSFVLGANVENLVLTGSGNISGTGNSDNNTLTGSSGNNTLDGGAGGDAMASGAGNDTYVVDDAGDTVSENSDEGTDTVQASVSFALGANVENLTLTGSGNISGTGNSDNNTLTGNSGNNTLDGGAGADMFIGGAGNDTYVVDVTGETIIESSGQGTDIVLSSVNYALGGNVENLTLTGSTAIGGTGNILNNTLIGNSGANTLNGGAGADAMIGGLGNDFYVVDNAGDTISEGSATGGTDVVQTFVTYSLVGTGYVENVLLAGTSDIGITGNVVSNTFWGNSGANVMNGGGGDDTMDGGLGADTMSGGTGNDYFFIDNAGDTVIENSGEGSDTVQSTISVVLFANVENLVLVGNTDLSATGNDLNNRITGNPGNNTVDGGIGADAMTGGFGNDTYIVDNVGDTISEGSASGGTDLVLASVTCTLIGTGYAENLTLTGSADINATGNFMNNTLVGNDGANTLSGGTGNDTLIGGLGADTLIGGAQADSFVFNSALSASNIDAITDFSVVDDTVSLNAAIFTGLAAGTLAASAFVIGSAAVDADDHIIYDNTTGALCWDPDGVGGADQIQFATLTAGLSLTNNDFLIFGP